MKDTTFECTGCKKVIRTRSVTPELADMKKCPQCYTKECCKQLGKYTYLENATEALVAVRELTPTQKERMLLDMVWKSYDEPKGLTKRQIVSVAYNTAILVP